MARKTLSQTAAQILQHLRATRSRKTVYATALAMGMDYDIFNAALEEFSGRGMVVRVRGQGGYVCAY